MGSKPEEYEPGNQCVRCWGDGKEFGDYPTPKRLTITGSGFVPPAEGANSSWVLTQDPINPCYWDGQSGDYIAYLEFDALNSLCEVKKGAVIIFAGVDVPCVLEFDQGAKHVSIS